MIIKAQVMSSDLRKKLRKASPEALKFFVARTRAYSDPYTPFDTGRLKNTVREESNKKMFGLVMNADLVYTAPYAKYVWYGKPYWNWHNGGMQVGGLRGCYWVLRAYADKGDQIETEVRKFIVWEMNR